MYSNYDPSVGIAAGISSLMSNLFTLAIAAYSLFVMWKIYEKMGLPGWKAIIPGYNLWVLFEVVWGSGPKMFMLLIPIYGIVIEIKTWIRLGHAFGKSTGFGVGLALLNPIFQSILAFTNAEFIGIQD